MLLPASFVLAADPTPPATGYTLTASLSVDQKTVNVAWTAPANHSTTDWVGLYKPSAADTDYLGAGVPYQYLSAAASGTMTFAVPADAGTYEARLFTNNAYTKVATSAPIIVSGVVSGLTAKIDSPRADQLLSGDSVLITGTSEADSQFDYYDLSWGPGTAPTSWSYITTRSSAAVIQGTLATWNISGITQSPITIRLRTYNKAGTATTAKVTVRILNLYGISVSNTDISPNGDGVQDAATITASITQPVNWTVEIKPTPTGLPTKNFNGSGTTISAVWNGTDNLGNPAPEGSYVAYIRVAEPMTSLTDEDKTGTIAVDRTVPTAAITSPAEIQTILTDDALPFTGTADDAHFVNYTLAYGAGTTPSTFTTLVTSTAKVVNGTLYTLDTRQLAPATYTFRLTVTDRAGTTSIVDRHATLDYLQITNVSAAPTFINPDNGGTATISYTLDRKADVAVQLYQELTKQLKRTLIQSFNEGGTKTVTWDGKDSAGAIAPSEAYYFTIVATDASGRRGTYNNAASPRMGPTPSYGVSVDATHLDPYRNNPVSISYDLSAIGRVTIQIQDSPYTTGGSIMRTLLNQAIRSPGAHTEYWDGRRDDGSVFHGSFGVVAGAGVSLPLNPIVLTRGVSSIDVTDFRAEAYLIQPVFGEVSLLTYRLSGNANVSVTLTDPNGNVVRTLLSNAAQTNGSQTLEWDGRTDSGKIVSVEGEYMVTLTGVDPVTGLSAKRFGSILVYK